MSDKAARALQARLWKKTNRTAERPPDSSKQIPPLRLPSRFHPNHFRRDSAGRGARPASLKQVDEKLEALFASSEDHQRYEQLKELKGAVDDFLSRYRQNNERLQAASHLKTWVDSALKLRSPMYETSTNEDETGTSGTRPNRAS